MENQFGWLTIVVTAFIVDIFYFKRKRNKEIERLRQEIKNWQQLDTKIKLAGSVYGIESNILWAITWFAAYELDKRASAPPGFFLYFQLGLALFSVGMLISCVINYLAGNAKLVKLSDKLDDDDDDQ